MAEDLSIEFDWYCKEIEKERAELDRRRQAFFEQDGKVSRIERERAHLWHRMAQTRHPQDTRP